MRTLKVRLWGLTAAVALSTSLVGAATATSSAASPPARGAAASADPSAPRCADGVTPTIVISAAAEAQSQPSRPPTGFSPLKATAAELHKYGFPARPPAGKDAEWLRAMASWKGFAPAAPTWTCGDDHHAPMAQASGPVTASSPGGSDVQDSPNWAGNLIHGSGNQTYTYVEMSWIVPGIAADYNTNGGHSQVNIWPGLGYGSGSGDELVQLGTATDVEGTAGTDTWSRLWYEVYPKEGVQYTAPFSIGPGDQMYMSVTVSGSNAHFWMQRLNGGYSYSHDESFNGNTGGTAEWIVEKGNSPVPLGVWNGALVLNSANASGPNVGWTSAGSGFHTSIHMRCCDSYYATGPLVANGGAWLDPPNYAEFPMYRTGNQDH